MSTSEFLSFVFPKLYDSVYTTWMDDLKVLQMDRGCWSFLICEEIPFPEKSTEKERFEYDWRKQRCYASIYQGIERKFLPLIRQTTNGKQAWDVLKSNFEPISRARLMDIIL
ncbi:hypothetical protein AVEN_179293-1 [Araneus ventricosus]|uniref:Uncharacterized protein n=1 Tax=Araneus ventricosus TaxID=182803 RepID=A0A4Y2L8D9_ARAVE|nr:hypothetical protein AVEN_179293-1 [Araneus ventricosus]